MDDWRVGWAREDGHIRQVMAPGHSRRRCVYVDFLNSGPAIAATLRKQIARVPAIQRVSNLMVVDLLVDDGRVAGAIAIDAATSREVAIAAGAVVLAAGGLTKLYARNSASANMGGDACALALRAGADLVDMEFVQFFPIGHLAPRLVGMDPIMWDPFRYKLGGRLLNGRHEEFIDRYGGTDDGNYTTTRDRATYAILKEVDAGRGSPHGGAWLDFRHVPEADLRDAFGPVIDRLLANGIDLTRTPIEVSPIAHYHMGGVRVGASLESNIPGLFAAGEAVGGANGANRLSGNAITEALVFGESAGRRAAESAATRNGEAGPGAVWRALASDAVRALERDRPRAGGSDARTPAAVQTELQRVMLDQAGPLRDAARLQSALDRIREWQLELPRLAVAGDSPFNLDRLDWIELRGMLLVAETIVLSALRRTESRGAHQREDCPATDRAWDANQVASLVEGAIHLRSEAVVRLTAEELR